MHAIPDKDIAFLRGVAKILTYVTLFSEGKLPQTEDLASAILSSSFKLLKRELSKFFDRPDFRRTIFASLTSKDRDFRTYLIVGRWLSDFKESYPELRRNEKLLFGLLA